MTQQTPQHGCLPPTNPLLSHQVLAGNVMWRGQADNDNEDHHNHDHHNHDHDDGDDGDDDNGDDGDDDNGDDDDDEIRERAHQRDRDRDRQRNRDREVIGWYQQPTASTVTVLQLMMMPGWKPSTASPLSWSSMTRQRAASGPKLRCSGRLRSGRC
eukprot:3849683-Rhodomonas_salina.1